MSALFSSPISSLSLPATPRPRPTLLPATEHERRVLFSSGSHAPICPSSGIATIAKSPYPFSALFTEQSSMPAAPVYGYQVDITRCIGEAGQISWDMTLPPRTATIQGTRQPTQAIRAQPATVPPRGSLLLQVVLLSQECPNLLCITPSSREGYVTVGDVLDCVYRYLCLPIPRDVVDSLNAKLKWAVLRSYRRRYQRFLDRPERFCRERDRGPKYVDFLCGKSRWGGISGSLANEGEYMIYTL